MSSLVSAPTGAAAAYAAEVKSSASKTLEESELLTLGINGPALNWLYL